MITRQELIDCFVGDPAVFWEAVCTAGRELGLLVDEDAEILQLAEESSDPAAKERAYSRFFGTLLRRFEAGFKAIAEILFPEETKS